MTQTLRNIIGCCGFVLLSALPVDGQTFTGTSSCGGSECHTRSGEIAWHSTQPGGREHRASIGRLKQSPDKSEKYAKDVGLADFLDPKGMCVKCHGQPVGGVIEGVGCEGCHGPAGGYRSFHQQNTTDYRGAVAKGMRDLKGKPTAWTKVCVACHVLDGQDEYSKLLDSGHPDGRRWKPQNKYTGVQAHWKRISYTVDVVTAAAAGKAITVAVKSDEPAKPEPPKPDPAKPEPPKPEPPKPEPGKPEPPKPEPPKPEPPKPVSTRDPVKPRPPKPEPPKPEPPKPDPPVVGPTRADPAAPVVTSPLSLTPPPPSNASELLAALQSRVAALFTRLLASGATPDVPLKPLPAPAKIAGADAELLQLQAEALSLAIEALNLKAKPPAKPPDK